MLNDPTLFSAIIVCSWWKIMCGKFLIKYKTLVNSFQLKTNTRRLTSRLFYLNRKEKMKRKGVHLLWLFLFIYRITNYCEIARLWCTKITFIFFRLPRTLIYFAFLFGTVSVICSLEEEIFIGFLYLLSSARFVFKPRFVFVIEQDEPDLRVFRISFFQHHETNGCS